MYAFPYNTFMRFYQLFFCVLAYFVIDALRFHNMAQITVADILVLPPKDSEAAIALLSH